MTEVNTEQTQDKNSTSNLQEADIKNTPKEENKTSQDTNQEEGKGEDPNWRAFREARKKDRAEREAAEKRAREKEEEVAALKAAMEAAFSKSGPTPQAYNEHYYGSNSSYDNEESEDERLEKKLNYLLSQREEKARREAIEREMREYPSRLERDFPDFRSVISQENLDYIDYHYPEIARPLNRLNEGYDKWADIYRAVKKFVPNNTTSHKENMKADNNQNKPKSISSSGQAPIGEVGQTSYRETEQRRRENWERMQRVMKGL